MFTRIVKLYYIKLNYKFIICLLESLNFITLIDAFESDMQIEHPVKAYWTKEGQVFTEQDLYFLRTGS